MNHCLHVRMNLKHHLIHEQHKKHENIQEDPTLQGDSPKAEGLRNI